VNPGPDEELQVADTLYLLGNTEQLARARCLLADATDLTSARG